MLYLQIRPASITQTSTPSAKRPSSGSVVSNDEDDEASGEPARKVVSVLIYQYVVAADFFSCLLDSA